MHLPLCVSLFVCVFVCVCVQGGKKVFHEGMSRDQNIGLGMQAALQHEDNKHIQANIGGQQIGAVRTDRQAHFLSTHTHLLQINVAWLMHIR